MTKALALLAAAVALMTPATAMAKQSDPPAPATLAIIGDTPYRAAQVARPDPSGRKKFAGGVRKRPPAPLSWC